MNLPRMQLSAGGHALTVYVARSQQERAQGLMHRRELPCDEGMLFMSDAPRVQRFWMGLGPGTRFEGPVFLPG